ncbi:pantoate--beta-alanine ligase [bacterium]|nr:MAG: pantoate--beta-alanine ligase [bacterium]
MQIVEKISNMQSYVKKNRLDDKSIGFVPTMGYFHEGHLSLMRIARQKCDILIVSIFVNPTQFGPNDDFDKYPRDFDRDKKLCERENVDAIFIPSAEEMYPKGFIAYVDMDGDMTEVLCGKYRSRHFRGVMTVVSKLFNIVQPDIAVFGRKDGQQLALIRRMVADLNFPIEIIGGRTIRENDGLAMSSRNKYLNSEQRKSAPALYKSLLLAKTMIENGETDSFEIIAKMKDFISNSGDFEIQYIDIVDADTLKPVNMVQNKVMIALAVFLGETRLIDNIIV